ncbi:MAG: hypothetical protein V4619_08280 [Bacteroidota bacterium]
MKKLVLVFALVLGASVATFAQNGGGNGGNGGGGRGGRNPERQIARLKETLTLTDAQVTKVTEILTAQGKVQDSIRTANAGGDRAAMAPAQAKLRKATSDKITAVLTADQATIYKKQLEDQAKAMAERQANGN